MRRLLLERVHQPVECGVLLAGDRTEDRRALDPGQHDEHERDGYRERHPRAFEDFYDVGREEHLLDE